MKRKTVRELNKELAEDVNDIFKKAGNWSFDEVHKGKPEIRTFDSGGTRDTANGKIHYYGFQHPLCDYSFGKYMLGHQKQADGKMREANNWWHGWDRGISLDSMTRHLEDLKLIHAGYYVYKKRTDTGEETIVSKKELKGLVQVTEEEACNAIRFNADAYKLEVLKNYGIQ